MFTKDLKKHYIKIIKIRKMKSIPITFNTDRNVPFFTISSCQKARFQWFFREKTKNKKHPKKNIRNAIFSPFLAELNLQIRTISINQPIVG